MSLIAVGLLAIAFAPLTEVLLSGDLQSECAENDAPGWVLGLVTGDSTGPKAQAVAWSDRATWSREPARMIVSGDSVKIHIDFSRAFPPERGGIVTLRIMRHENQIGHEPVWELAEEHTLAQFRTQCSYYSKELAPGYHWMVSYLSHYAETGERSQINYPD